jgi:hypothetical protein
MLGITIRSSEPAHPFWRMVERASAFEVEPSLSKLGYQPHLTFVRYDNIDPARLAAALDSFDGCSAFTLLFDRICMFDTDPLVLWLAPHPDSRLLAIHAQVHAAVGVHQSDPHYRPGVWRPHCTIATAVSAELQHAARAFTNEPIEPFKITFDFADALEWPPIVQIDTRHLVQSQSDSQLPLATQTGP